MQRGVSTLDLHDLQIRSAEHLPLDKQPSRQNVLLPANNLSTSSLPYLPGRPTTSRVGSIADETARASASGTDDLDDTDEEVPGTIVFHNIPISPTTDHSRTFGQSAKSMDRLRSNSNLVVSTSLDVEFEEPSRQKVKRPLSYHDSLLNELGEDTRELTAQLNDHHTQQLHAQTTYPNETPIHCTSTRSRSERKASAKKMAQSLRPVIDHDVEALPISKEKEAILACTRPTHLPPKSRKEEKKHLKEYERLLLGSLEAERKSQKRQSKQVTQKAKHLANSADTWTNQIIPHFASAVKDPRTRTLWWSGLPNRVRGRIWSICIGNALTVNEDTFRMALTKSLDTERHLQERMESEADEEESELLTLQSYTLLEDSVATTFVDLKIFQAGGPLHEPLVQVLKAYLYYRQDVMVSYIEGVNFIAGLLLLYLPPVQTFVTMVNVLNRALPLALYTRDEPVLNRFSAMFSARLSQALPRLHKHLNDELHIPPLSYLEPMLFSLLAKQSPIDISSRIFDIYAFEGDAFLMRAVIGIFISLEHALYGTAQEVLLVLSGKDKEHTWEKNLKEDEFIKRCRTAF